MNAKTKPKRALSPIKRTAKLRLKKKKAKTLKGEGWYRAAESTIAITIGKGG